MSSPRSFLYWFNQLADVDVPRLKDAQFAVERSEKRMTIRLNELDHINHLLERAYGEERLQLMREKQDAEHARDVADSLCYEAFQAYNQAQAKVDELFGDLRNYRSSQVRVGVRGYPLIVLKTIAHLQAASIFEDKDPKSKNNWIKSQLSDDDQEAESIAFNREAYLLGIDFVVEESPSVSRRAPRIS